MKYLYLMVAILWINVAAAQNYPNILNYNFNGTPTNGVKIKTNLPFTAGSQMPTITIKGYNYNTAKVIDLTLVYYIYYSGDYNNPSNFYFHNPGISSSGGYVPKIFLSNENGKVIIYIDDRTYFQRFTISAFADGISEQSSWFQGWSVADEALTGANTIEVPYQNKFKGDVSFSDNGIWSANGNLGVGTVNPSSPFQVEGAPIQNWLVTLDNKEANGHKMYFGYGNSSSTNYGLLIRGGRNLAGQLDFAVENKFYVMGNGDVGIGTATPKERLSVNGKIRAHEIKVETTNWPDYVFEEGYEVGKLSALENYIKENKHLPEMPTAKHIEANGMELGEMIKLQQKKIEELTLYLIEKDKQISTQQDDIKLFKVKLQEQGKMLLEIQKTINKKE